MHTRFSLLLAFFVGVGLLSCGPTKPKADETPAEKPKVEGPSLVGRIASVPADKRFVLIQRYGKWEGLSGQILTTRGPDERSANLRTTGEKLGEFAAADIQSGTVEPGDAVYLHHIPKPVTPAPDAAPTDPPMPELDADVENVQKNI